MSDDDPRKASVLAIAERRGEQNAPATKVRPAFSSTLVLSAVKRSLPWKRRPHPVVKRAAAAFLTLGFARSVRRDG